jgi:queuine tRNA-ribosyltransferase
VKTVDPADPGEVAAQVSLANTYHLALRPGGELIERLGGLHRFMGWGRPILTDSGGFQIWSRARRVRGQSLVRLDEHGVTFRSHLDGSRWRFTPERAIDVQAQLGADIVMAVDERTPEDRPRYAMRVGDPADFLEVIE